MMPSDGSLDLVTHQLELLARVLAVVAVVAAVLAANLFIARWLVNSIRGPALVVVPFRVVDSAGKKASVEPGMAQLLVARIEELNRNVDRAQKELLRVARDEAGDALLTAPGASNLISLETSVLPSTQLQVSVGGVQVTGFFKWWHSLFARGRTISLIVSYGPEEATVAGDLAALKSGQAPLWLGELPPEPTRVVDAVAHRLYQLELSTGRWNQLESLSWQEFASVVTSLSEAARLNEKYARRGAAPEQFKTLLQKILPLAQRLDHWPELMELTGEIAQQAGEESVALELFTTASKLLASANRPTDALDEKVSSLRSSPEIRDRVATIVTKAPETFPVPPSAVTRSSVDRLTAQELAQLRAAFAALMSNGGSEYSFLAGIHGRPLPMWGQHGTLLFLPWHRAYLHTFEVALQKQQPGVSIPFWDWVGNPTIPRAFATSQLENGAENPLFQARYDVGQGPRTTSRDPRSEASLRQLASGVSETLLQRSFEAFSRSLEMINGGVHVWVRGEMGSVPTASYDPIFWVHQANVDRIWQEWLDAGGAMPEDLLEVNLQPFGLKVREVLNPRELGYSYDEAPSR